MLSNLPEMTINFTCNNCGDRLLAEFMKEDASDIVHCNCGKVWTVIKPIDTVYKED